MLSIFILILKIIGILLLIILGSALFVLLLILLAPVCYSCKGEFLKQRRISGKINWMGFVISLPFTMDEKGFRYQFKIFGIQLNKQNKKEKKQNKIAEKQNKKANKQNRKSEKQEKKPDNIPEELPEASVKDFEDESINPLENISQASKKTKSKAHKSIFSKIREKIENVRALKKKLLQKAVHFGETLQKISQKVSDLNDKKETLLDFLAEEETIIAKEKLFCLIKKIIHHIFPQKLSARLKFGLEYPDQTGDVYALLCMLYNIYGDNLVLEPDFENEILEGNFFVKGRIRLLNCINYGIKLYRIKKIKELIELMKSE